MLLSVGMKNDIHPKYNADAKINCACGNSLKAGSVKEKIDVEICSACHPFFTGKEKMIDTAGRVEKFKNRAAGAAKTVRKKSEKKQQRREEKAKKAATA